MKNVAGVPVRRVSAEIFGDQAVDLEIMEVSLGLNRATRSKGDRDAKLVTLALAALRKAVSQYSAENRVRYPELGEFSEWLGIQPERSEDAQMTEVAAHPAMVPHVADDEPAPIP